MILWSCDYRVRCFPSAPHCVPIDHSTRHIQSMADDDEDDGEVGVFWTEQMTMKDLYTEWSVLGSCRGLIANAVLKKIGSMLPSSLSAIGQKFLGRNGLKAERIKQGALFALIDDLENPNRKVLRDTIFITMKTCVEKKAKDKQKK